MMSNPNVDPAHWKPASATDPKVSQIDANLRLATENAQPIRLRRLLQELCQTQPDAHKVTGALLLATQLKYTEKIKANKGTQSDEEEEEEEDDDENDKDDKDESESDGSSDVGEISELSSEEEEADEESDDDSDDDMKTPELGLGEDDGTDEEGASTTTSTRHMPVKSELRRRG